VLLRVLQRVDKLGAAAIGAAASSTVSTAAIGATANGVAIRAAIGAAAVSGAASTEASGARFVFL
jgi:hypothetical protein